MPKHYDYNFGELHGEGHRRFAFLRRIMCETPVSGLRPSFREYYFDNLTSFQVNVIDTWNMTIEDKGVFYGKFRIELPGREYMAVQIKKII